MLGFFCRLGSLWGLGFGLGLGWAEMLGWLVGWLGLLLKSFSFFRPRPVLVPSRLSRLLLDSVRCGVLCWGGWWLWVGRIEAWRVAAAVCALGGEKSVIAGGDEVGF